MLQQICGVNDQNLRVLEQLFHAPVLVRGNELYLDSDNVLQQRLFVTLMTELEQHASHGQTPNRGLINALHQDLSVEDGRATDALRQHHIDIPAAGAKVFPRSARQARILHHLQNTSLTFLVGPAGTGKTFLAVAHALQEVLAKRKRKLVLTRPVVEAGESLGFLPGDLTQKISPYLRPLYDAIETLLPFEILRRLEEQNVIEIAPLAYMRGRSLRDSYIILDEAQNTSKEQMKMFLTRLGENSRAVVTGDITQVDLPKRIRSGLLDAVSILDGIEDVSITYLNHEDVVRSPLVQRIIQAYDDHRE